MGHGRIDPAGDESPLGDAPRMAHFRLALELEPGTAELRIGVE